LHEFLPDRTELAIRVAVAEAKGDTGDQVQADRRLLAAVENMHESNPMLGLRGVRLGLLTPGLFALQVRAIGEAASAQIAAGKDPRVEIMVPLVGSVMELHLMRDEAEQILADVAADKHVTLTIPIGTMIELPRAALTAHRVADAADFFSFGTNDLTQTTSSPQYSPPTSTEACSPSPRSKPSTPTAWDGSCRSRPPRAANQTGPQTRGVRRARR
jgi:pyruvate, orthophosphate dikinase